jgi:hypothetical protein
VDERRAEASQLRDHIDRLNEEKNIILRGKQLLEQQVITGQVYRRMLTYADVC